MENITCKSCGGSVTRAGNYYVCDYCRNKWEIDSGNDIHAVDRANAWSTLRDGDFEKAAELFENLILKDGKNHEAYWGRALALGGIIYVTDMSENKKVPTCNNITEESFLHSKDVEKAISLAPADIAATYKEQASYIERVRMEWLDKASKEPAYDVFISFKDSDREHGIERTQDSVDAQDLYNALVAEGYKVFFSRISLRDKISEQYEPYIYNAIKTAKVMIVFGEKPEYFSSVWIKNEWSRFKTRIEKGEKHKNSLVVVYKNMNPGDLPVVLKSRQCLNAADMTFLSDLNRHLKRVVEESKQATRLDKIEIKGGQVAKKASKIENETLKTREIGAGAVAETSITEKQQLSLLNSYINGAQWEDAEKLVEDILFNSPALAEAILAKLMIRLKVSDDEIMIEQLPRYTPEDYGLLEKYLNCTGKESAADLLCRLYEYGEYLNDAEHLAVLKVILPFNFDKREHCINQSFKDAIKQSKLRTFKLLLTTLDSEAVDLYVSYYLSFAGATKSVAQKKECIEAVLAVDEGNYTALCMRLSVHWTSESASVLTSDLVEILKYSKRTKQDVAYYVDQLAKTLANAEQCAFAKQILKYYPGEIAELTETLKRLAYRMISHSFFADAEYLLGLLLASNPNDPDIYWYVCLVKLQAKDEKSILGVKTSIKEIPEYTKYLTMVGEARRQECMALANRQIKKAKGKKKFRKFLVMATSVILAIILLVNGVNYLSTLPLRNALENGTFDTSYVNGNYNSEKNELKLIAKHLTKCYKEDRFEEAISILFTLHASNVKFDTYHQTVGFSFWDNFGEWVYECVRAEGEEISVSGNRSESCGYTLNGYRYVFKFVSYEYQDYPGQHHPEDLYHFYITDSSNTMLEITPSTKNFSNKSYHRSEGDIMVG